MDSATVSDHLQIANLLSRYCHLLDEGGHAEDIGGLFTVDAELTVIDTEVRGRPAIVDWFQRMDGAPAYTVHSTSNSFVTIDGDRASALSNWVTFRLGNASRKWEIFAVGRYTDEFVRTGSGWLFSSRFDSVVGGFTGAEIVQAYLQSS